MIHEQLAFEAKVALRASAAFWHSVVYEPHLAVMRSRR